MTDNNRLWIKSILLLISICFFNTAIAKELVIARGDGEYPPFEFHRDGKLTGFHIELIEAVAKQAGISIRFVSLPWKRAVHEMETGGVDAITYFSKTDEREAYTFYLPDNLLSIVRNHFVVLDTSTIRYDSNIENIKPYTLGLLNGFTYGDKIDNDNDIRKFIATRRENLVQMLKFGRVDLILVNPLKLHNKFHQTTLMDSLKVLNPPVSSLRNYLGFSKLTDQMKNAESIANQMRKFKSTDAFRQLEEKYDVKL